MVARAVRDRGEPQVAAYVVAVAGSTLDARSCAPTSPAGCRGIWFRPIW
ncbi:hypothetical protein ACFSNO_31395 [Streptomyces cirratus]